MEQIQRSFGVWDYVVFGGLFVISAGIGIFFAFISRKNQSTSDDYLMGSRQMHAVPVAFSMIASFLSAVTVIGLPSEFYIYGTMFAYFAFPYVIVAIVCAELYIPLFYRNGITSTYEYLELRFNRQVRLVASAIFIINQVLYIGIVIYAPALALNAVTGLNIWMLVIVTGVVCTLYTTLGGLKAVIWTDVFQCIVMFVGFIAVVIQGCILLGGFENVWSIAESRGRVDFVHFEGDPRIRHTFWSIIVGGTMLWTGTYATTQTSVQRYLCCKSENHARAAVYLNAFGLLSVMVLAGLAGLTMFAYYANCDPYSAGWVSATDQLMPYFTLEIMYDYPGLPGVYLCSAFSGTLSTVSSGINAMAAVTLEDYIKPYKKITQRQSLWLSKGLVIIYGACCLAMTLVAANLGGIVNAALSINGMISGPMVALFTMAWAFPWCNSWGALIGVLSGLAVSVWCYVGSTIYPPPNKYVRVLPRSTVSCLFPSQGNVTEMTTILHLTTKSWQSTTTQDDRPPIAEMYSLSYLYYGVFGFIVALVVGHAVSFMTGYQLPSELPKGVTIAFFDHPLFSWLPKKVRRFLWCGVPYDKYENTKQQSFTLSYDDVSLSQLDEEQKRNSLQETDGTINEAYCRNEGSGTSAKVIASKSIEFTAM